MNFTASVKSSVKERSLWWNGSSAEWLFSRSSMLCHRKYHRGFNAALTESQNAIQFILILLGSMCLWGGFLKIAERSGLTVIIAKFLSPFTSLLFPSLKKDSKALTAISMNITANLLGLGNAATPFGITAMKALKMRCRVPKTIPPVTRWFCLFCSIPPLFSFFLLPLPLWGSKPDHTFPWIFCRPFYWLQFYHC